MNENSEANSFMLSYYTLRNIIGWIAILLPFALVIGNVIIFSSTRMESSISRYYFTDMGDVFVGGLCAVALFMFFYIGPKPIDNWMGNFAGLFAVATAWFPTSQEGYPDWVSKVHFGSAGLLFVVLSIFCLYLFRKTNLDTIPKGSKKAWRNLTYTVCGLTLIGCILAMAGYFIYGSVTGNDPYPNFIFWGETIGLLAFGWSWIVKGESLPMFRDAK